jgi:hypothetical protein
MKQNRIILLVVIVLAIVAGILVFTQTTNTLKKDVSDFAIEDTSTVTKIFMSDKNNHTVTLTRTPSGNWLVNDTFPASSFNVNMLLATMHNLAVKEPVPQVAHNNVILEMAVNAVKTEIYQKRYRIDLFGMIRWFPHEKRTKVYFVGGATQSNRGTYMLMEGAETPFVTYLPGFRGFVSPRYQPIAKYWRDYTIFRKHPAAIASVRVELPGRESESYVVTNNNMESVSLYTYPENNPIPVFDTLAVLNFLTGFQHLSYEALLNDSEGIPIDSIVHSPPFLILTLTDTSGTVQTVKTFFKPGKGDTDMDGNPIPYDLDRLYALVNDGKDFVLIQYFAFDRVLRPRSFFLKDFMETN